MGGKYRGGVPQSNCAGPMLFNSPAFIFAFLPVTLLGFYLLARCAGRRAAMGWLVAASLFFYGWWNPVYLALLGGSILFNYLLGARLGRLRGGRGSRWLLGF